MHRHLEVGRLALPPLAASVAALVWRIDDDSAVREAAAETAGTAAGVAGVGRSAGVVGVDVAFCGIVGVGVVDIEGLGRGRTRCEG